MRAEYCLARGNTYQTNEENLKIDARLLNAPRRNMHSLAKRWTTDQSPRLHCAMRPQLRLPSSSQMSSVYDWAGGSYFGIYRMRKVPFENSKRDDKLSSFWQGSQAVQWDIEGSNPQHGVSLLKTLSSLIGFGEDEIFRDDLERWWESQQISGMNGHFVCLPTKLSPPTKVNDFCLTINILYTSEEMIASFGWS